MSLKANSKAPVKASKRNPVPVRFDGAEDQVLDDIATATGLKKAEIIRRAGRYAFPKFLSREVNILDIVPTQNGKAVPA